MRFLLTEEFWVLDHLNPAEWHFLSELPGTAAGEWADRQAQDRLYPLPLAEDELLDEESFDQVEDWNELVRPELEGAFRQARETVETDLAGVMEVPQEEAVDPDEVDDEDLIEFAAHAAELKRVVVPLEHAEPWYSTLNQARLLLNEVHNLADSDDRFLLRESDPEIEPRRAMLLAQYEIYSAIQSILVENVMQ